MGIALICFVVVLLLGIPIAFVLALTGMIHLAAIDLSYLAVVPQRMFAGINSSSLTCIPFFIVAGELMNGGGVTQKLMEFVKELVGYVKGGLAYATIVTAAILSAILGSPNAVSSILCSVLLPDLKKEGYDMEFGGALIAASGVLGPIIPPSTTFVIFATLSGVSVKGLFMAGIIPGILIAISYVFVVALYVRRKGLPRAIDHIAPRRLLRSFVQAIPALVVPLVIVGGVMTGAFTPTESGAVSCVAAVLAGMIYRSFDFKHLPQMLLRAGSTSAAILFIIAAGNILGYSLEVDNIPSRVAAAVLSWTSSKALIILLLLAVMIVVGCLMEATAAITIFTPVMMTIVTAIGMDGLHFGLVFCIMMTIALITPPVGMLLFVTSNISKIELTKLNRAILPFCLAAFAVTFALAYLPDVALFVPRLFGYGG